MSEEQSGFKVTDRRLFNADGTPRDVEREEAPAQTASPQPASESASSATEAAASAPAAAPPAEASRVSEIERPASQSGSMLDDSSSQEELPEEAYDEGDIPGANDPASFISFLMSIASNAAAALGMMEHPVTGQRGVDLPLGKHWIDVLGMLQEKTRGNLAPQEQQIFTGLLSDLRMQYVSLSSAPSPKRPGGFSASDILGGK
ncbi:MAG TPA: DUF1844 domain-containing protein [Pyrinomonadaceae bacterium]